jgi:hypothetical protein
MRLFLAIWFSSMALLAAIFAAIGGLMWIGSLIFGSFTHPGTTVFTIAISMAVMSALYVIAERDS